jgi:uncharacterized membrane protein
MITKRIPYILLAIGAIGVGLYPLMYFFMDQKFGLLNSKSDLLLADAVWNGMFYTHITLGGVALLIGWIQFSKKIQRTNIRFHRGVGKVYMIAVLFSGIASLYIGYYATGGWIPKLGFISLGLVWLYTTFRGYTSIRKKDILTHQKMMTYSYAACFAAVTLRIWLPLLTVAFGAFLPAYKIVAWLCWVPNLLIAYYIIQKKFTPALSTS